MSDIDRAIETYNLMSEGWSVGRRRGRGLEWSGEGREGGGRREEEGGGKKMTMGRRRKKKEEKKENQKKPKSIVQREMSFCVCVFLFSLFL